MKPLDYLPEEAHRSNPYGEATVHIGEHMGFGNLVTVTGRDDQGMKYIASYWKFNEDELERFIVAVQNGEDILIELTVIGETTPPVALNLMNGFE